MNQKKKILLQEIIKGLHEEVINFRGEDKAIVSYPASLIGASSGEALSFCVEKDEIKLIEKLSGTKAGTLICCDLSKEVFKKLPKKNYISVKNPRLFFLKVVKQFFLKENNKRSYIHPTAIVSLSAKVDPTAYIGPYTLIEEGVFIGSYSIIEAGCHIYSNTKIGSFVTVYSNCVIGSAGFGLEMNSKGEYEKFPHLGGVIIDDEVEIGANSCIDRGTLDNTVIGRGVKIDNLVHIAHNVQIGRNTIITAGVVISGSVEVGEGVWMGPGSTILNKVKIGSYSTIGIGAVISHRVNQKATMFGNPASKINTKSVG